MVYVDGMENSAVNSCFVGSAGWVAMLYDIGLDRNLFI